MDDSTESKPITFTDDTKLEQMNRHWRIRSEFENGSVKFIEIKRQHTETNKDKCKNLYLEQ